MDETQATFEGEVVPGVEVEPVEAAAPPPTLFRTDDPVEVLENAQRAADALMRVVRAKGMLSNIQGKDYMRVEGWQTLGQMLGVTPVTVSTTKLEDGWEARVEARTLDGRVIGAAEAECLRAERQWRNRDDFALRSMAQTRAQSKALASVLRFIATLGGIEGTPYEEMPRDGVRGGKRASGKRPISTAQKDFLNNLLTDHDVPFEERQTIVRYAEENLTGGKDGSMWKSSDKLKSEPDEYLPRLREAARKWADDYSDIPADTEDLKGVDELVAEHQDESTLLTVDEVADE